MKIGTPNNIDVLLHYHCCMNKHPRHDAIVVQETIEALLSLKVIEPYNDKDGCYLTTDLGKAWVQALCNTELPTVAYLDKNGEVLL